MDVFKELVNKVQEKYQQRREDEAKYQELLTSCATLPQFYSLPKIDKKTFTISYKPLMEECPDLNESDAIVVRGLIPMEEVCLFCLYATECKTNLKFYFVATTSYLWLINKNGYLKYPYQGLIATKIKEGLMSKTILIGNMLFNIHGLEDKMNEFIRLFQDTNYQSTMLQHQLQFFCNTKPRICYLNDLASGLSIGEHNEIVFHTKQFHYKYDISDIENYELLLDDMVVREKRNKRSTRLTANKSSCYQMSIRITAYNQMFLLPILEKTAFSNAYSSTSIVFIDNKKFADTIINLLDELDEKRINGEA